MTDIISTKDKLACVTRELKMRQRVYPRWVTAGRISAGMAAHQIACMEAIVADYKGQASLERLNQLFDAPPSTIARLDE